MNLIERAQRFARIAHGDQRRKYTLEPYIVHCYEVGDILARVTDNENIIAAGILHDTIEDTRVTEIDLNVFFNAQIASLVVQVTDVSTGSEANRAARKEMDKLHLAKASPAAQTIKLADILDNTSSIVTHDPDFAKVYLKEISSLVEVLQKGHSTLFAEVCVQIHNAKTILAQDKEKEV